MRIFIFFILVFGILLGLSLVFPADGIAFGDDLKLRFVTSEELFSKDSVGSFYTDSLIQHALVSDDPEDENEDIVLLPVVQEDVQEVVPQVNMDSLVRARIDSVSRTVFPIEFAGSSRERLVDFFQTAERCEEDGELVRIVHYGDSQIENDRMTSLLRFRFQKLFGGSGCGMVPAIPLYFGNPTYKQTYKGDWVRKPGFGRRDSTLDHNSFGMMACFTTVPLPGETELPFLEFNFHEGRRASRFSKVNIFLHSHVEAGFITLQMNDSILDTVSNIPSGFQHISYSPDNDVKKIKIGFSLPDGGRVYGISFDPESGIQMDNIAMRGSAGLEFSSSDRATLESMINAVNPGLVIMQFGGNVVPYIKKSSHYKKLFKRELVYLRELFPDAAVVVIGPSDMATKENGRLKTFATLKPVRDALRQAALESDCAFWDMFEAMGGENSIQNFVLADPPLATSDYIHFTPKGANLMAGMFYDAVMLEYKRYVTASN